MPYTENRKCIINRIDKDSASSESDKEFIADEESSDK